MPASYDNLLPSDRVEVALLRYYTLFHPRELTRVRRLNGRRGRGLAVVANAGFSNVRLASLAASDADTARCLLYGTLRPGDRYFFVCDLRYSPWLERFLQHRSEETLNVVAVTHRGSFRPFAAARPAPERYQATRAHGLLPYFGYRCLHEGEPVSQAFVIWQSDRFAEIGVFTRHDFRGRGLARAVVSALTQELLDRNVTPLYIYDPANAASDRVRLALGYRPAGREFSCYATLPPLTPSRRAPG